MTRTRTLLTMILFCTCMLLSGCSGGLLIAGHAQQLGTVIKRADDVNASAYRAAEAAITGSDEYRKLAREQGADKAVNYYQECMRSWDAAVQTIKAARAAIFALGTAAESTRGADRSVTIVESAIYATATVLESVQTIERNGVKMPTEMLPLLSRVCLNLNTLTTGVRLPPDKIPAGCADTVRTGAPAPAPQPGP